MISIIIPLYNKERTILQSIESVLSQSFRDIELVVVDDGSTDSSASIVEGIGDNRLTLIKQENAGPSAARNTGAKEAKGDWIVFLDADDELCDDALKVMFQYTISHQDADIIDFNKYIRKDGKLTLQKHHIDGLVKNPLRSWYFREISPGCGHSIFKTSFAKQHPYDERFHRFEDADLLLRMLPVAKVYSSIIPTEIHDMDTIAASQPRKNIKEDYIGSLSLTAGGFWHKMCTYRLFIEERENYPEECKRLYPNWYYRYDLLCIYKFLQKK
jgi:glycosyltransferase involved in cell wall biosynthesis